MMVKNRAYFLPTLKKRARAFLLLIFCVSAACGEESVRFALARLGEPQLDPHKVQGDLELHINPNIFDGLYKIDPENGKLIPALATSYRWITPEVVEFRLRKGVRFHNGEPFNAEAVRFSFERMKSVREGFNWIKALIPEFQKVEIVDPYTVRIHFAKHNSIFLVSSRFFVILPPKYLQKHGSEHFKAYPVGTGAFKVEKIRYGQDKTKTIELSKNSHYWDAGFPKLDRVFYSFNLTQEESKAMLLRGELDAAGDLPVRSILDVKKNGFEVRSKKQGLLTWIYFNLTRFKQHTPIYDRRVREAILRAIDYEKIRKIAYLGHAKVNHQWAFPGLPGYSERLTNYAYTPVLAKELLKEAGIAKKSALNMYCDDVSLDDAKIIKSSLKAIGIEVNIDVLDEQTNNCILTAKNNPSSPCYEKLKYYDFMIGDFGWGVPHNFVSHLHTFSQRSFASLMDSSYPGAKDSIPLFERALHSDTNADQMWREITEAEFKRLGISGLFLKNTHYATTKNLLWDVYGSYEFTRASYRK